MKIRRRIAVLVMAWIGILLALLCSAGEVFAADLQSASSQTSTQSPDSETGQTSDKDSIVAKLVIDNENCYEGMDKTYSQGYVPRVEAGTVYLVVPLLCNTELQENRLRAALSLENSQLSPFVSKNYEKTISLQTVPINNGAGKTESYVVAFDLELQPDRYNGSYPVMLTVQGTDTKGKDLQQDFTIYVNITDGKDPNAEPTTEEMTEAPVTYAPKVMVESAHFSKETIQAGEDVKADITLVNTSQSEAIRNMTVTINAQEQYFTLLSESDSIYVDAIPAGGQKVVSVEYLINGAAPQGQYNLEVAMNYADTKGASYSESGRVKVNIVQPMRVEFDPLSIPETVQVADVVEAHVQVMNLGKCKAYNVRAEISADGLRPEGSIFIGDIEPGSMAAGSTTVSVSSLTEGNSLYGGSEGIVTYHYEDETGAEYEETAEFYVTINSPFSNQPQEPEDKTGQWWIIMAVIVGVVCIFAGGILIRRIRIRKRQEDEQKDEVVE